MRVSKARFDEAGTVLLSELDRGWHLERGARSSTRVAGVRRPPHSQSWEDTVFGRMRQPVLNNLGQTAFYAELAGDAVGRFEDSALWRHDPRNNDLKLLV